MVRRLCTLGLAASVALTGRAALAYCQTRTCDPRISECEVDPSDPDCIISGEPLHWPTDCVSFSLHEDASPLREITVDVARRVITDSYQAWLSVSCGSGFPSIGVVELEPISCGVSEYNQRGGNANAWIFRDQDWPYGEQHGADGTLAITTITFNTTNGEIYDADIEINSRDSVLTTTDIGVRADLQSIATHEIGHFFGLGHSDVPGATMYKRYSAGSTSLRSLEPDDAAGMCAIYPPGRQAIASDCNPRHGFATVCIPEESKGCSVTARRGAPASAAFAAALCLAAAGLLLRRRQH
jgi:hypothetical protein